MARHLASEHDLVAARRGDEAAAPHAGWRAPPVALEGRQVDPEDERREREGEGGRGIRHREHHDRRNQRHPRDGPQRGELLAGEEPPARHARDRAGAGAAHRDLAGGEVAPTLDQAAELLGERAQEHERRHPDCDAGGSERAPHRAAADVVQRGHEGPGL